MGVLPSWEDFQDICITCGSEGGDLHHVSCRWDIQWRYYRQDIRMALRRSRARLAMMVRRGVARARVVERAKRSCLANQDFEDCGLDREMMRDVWSWRDGSKAPTVAAHALGINGAALHALVAHRNVRPSFFARPFMDHEEVDWDMRWVEEDLLAIMQGSALADGLVTLPFDPQIMTRLPNRFSTSRLIERGWTRHMVRRFLGKGDARVWNRTHDFPRSATVPLFEVYRVLDVERSETFQATKAKSDNRRAASQTQGSHPGSGRSPLTRAAAEAMVRVAESYRDLLDYAEAYWSEPRSRPGWDGLQNPLPARAVVYYLLGAHCFQDGHTRTAFDGDRWDIRALPVSKAVRRRVWESIARVWPELERECLVQLQECDGAYLQLSRRVSTTAS